MIHSLVFVPALAAVAGLAFGASFYRHWEARAAKKKGAFPSNGSTRRGPCSRR